MCRREIAPKTRGTVYMVKPKTVTLVHSALTLPSGLAAAFFARIDSSIVIHRAVTAVHAYYPKATIRIEAMRPLWEIG